MKRHPSARAQPGGRDGPDLDHVRPAAGMKHRTVHQGVAGLTTASAAGHWTRKCAQCGGVLSLREPSPPAGDGVQPLHLNIPQQVRTRRARLPALKFSEAHGTQGAIRTCTLSLGKVSQGHLSQALLGSPVRRARSPERANGGRHHLRNANCITQLTMKPAPSGHHEPERTATADAPMETMDESNNSMRLVCAYAENPPTASKADKAATA